LVTPEERAMKWVLDVVSLASGEPHSHIVDSSGLLKPKLAFNSLKDCETARPMEALISDAMAGTMMCLAVDMSKSRVRKAGSAATLPPPASIVVPSASLPASPTNSKVIPPAAVAVSATPK
jgi:hypothetical protein